MKINFEIDFSKFDLDISELDDVVGKEVEKCAYKIQKTAKELCPVDTSTLRKSIDVDGGNLEYEVFTNVEYAHFIEYGTAPHVIKGNPYLKWKGMIYNHVTQVNHPGNKAYGYFEGAINTYDADYLAEQIWNAIKEIL